MPLYDYVCSSCSHHEEHFYRMSSIPDTIECEKCHAASIRTFDPSITMVRPRPALAFDPIVVHRTLGPDGQYVYSYPGNSNDPVPPGYEKVELSTIAQADRFVRDRNREEQELRRMQIDGEESYWRERSKDRREKAKIELEKRLGKSYSKVGDMVAKAIDARRERKYSALRNRAINFHIQALDFDRSNRPDYVDDSRKKISVVVNGSRR